MRNYFERKDVITKEIASKRIENIHGDAIILLEYHGTNKKAKLQCKEYGHVWEAVAYSIWNGNGCPKCRNIKISKRQAHPIEYIKNFIESRNCELLSNKYKNVDMKLLILFECGHTGEISFDCFKRGHRCTKCGTNASHLKCRLPEKELKERLSEKELEIIEFPNGYINRKSTVTCKCKFNHIETRSLATVLKTSGCSICAWIRLSVNNKGSKGSNWQGGESSLTAFLKKRIKNWKKESIAYYNYSCALCGLGHRFNDVHHLYNFFNIVNDSLYELNLDKRNSVKDYTNDELFLIVEKVLEIHYRYPLGVPLCRKHHRAFHHWAGIDNNTPEQFYEFQEKIKSGEIVIPE